MKKNYLFFSMIALAAATTEAGAVAPVTLTPEELQKQKEMKAEKLREEIKSIETGLQAMISGVGESIKETAVFKDLEEKKAKYERQLENLFKEKATSESEEKMKDASAFIEKLGGGKGIKDAFKTLYDKHATGEGADKAFRMGIAVTLNENGEIVLSYCRAVKPAAPSAPGATGAKGFGGGSTFVIDGKSFGSGRQAYEYLSAKGELPARSDFSGFNAAKPVRALMVSKPTLGIQEVANVDAPATNAAELPAQ